MKPRILSLLGAVGLGAGMVYLLDPRQGARRRTMLRDKAVHWWHEMDHTVEGKARHFANRAKGMYHEAARSIHKETDEMSTQPL